MGRLLAIGVIAVSAGLGVALHRYDPEPKGMASIHAEVGGSYLGTVEGWSFQHVDYETGAIEWEARGARATPDTETVWGIEAPALTLYERRGDRPQATSMTARRARASFPRAADTVIRLEADVVVTRGAWRVTTDEAALTLPNRGPDAPRTGGREARIATDRPVTLREDDPEVELRAAGLRADGALGRAVLTPPVAALLDPAALTASAQPRTEGRVYLDTDAPVEMRQTGEAAADLVFTGATRWRYERPGAPVLSGVAPGGTLGLRRPLPQAGPRSVTGVATAIDVRQGEVREGDVLVARFGKLAWDAARGVVVLEGRALLRSPHDGTEVEADRMEYTPRPGGAQAAATGDVRALAGTATFTAEIHAGRAEIDFAEAPAGPGRGAARGLAPGPLRRIHARDEVVGDVRPVTRTAEAPRGARAEAMDSDWHLEADDAVVEMDEAPAAGAAGEGARGAGAAGIGGRLGRVRAIRLAGEGRQALLASGARDRERDWRLEGARIEADRAEGKVAVFPAPGTVSRQTLLQGPTRLEAREIRYDETGRAAHATGEAILRKLHPSGRPALEAQADEATVRLSPAHPERRAGDAPPSPSAHPERRAGDAPPSPSAHPERRAGEAPLVDGASPGPESKGPESKGPESNGPESFELTGASGAVVRVVPELLSATADPARTSPVELRATRISGAFEPDAAGAPRLGLVRAEGAPGTPVVVVPAFDAPPEERFSVLADALTYDDRTGEVRPEGGAPVLLRGEERLSAPEVRFNVRTLAGSLAGGAKGRFLLPMPDEAGAASRKRTLFDLDANEATFVLARPGPGGRAAGKEALASLDARGKIWFRGGEGDDGYDVRADRLEYRRDARTVRLFGDPLEGHAGRNRVTGVRSYQMVLPPLETPVKVEKR